MILENSNYEEIRRLFEENNGNYITKWSNEHGINNPDMLKLLYVDDRGRALGYAIISFDRNFCEVEEYPNNIKNMPELIGYIWEVLVDKNYEGRGIGRELLEYAINKYNTYTFYSCIEEENIPSRRLHEKLGFKEIYSFIGIPFNDKIPKEIMYELRRI
jgi:ribosomal protein S18 acetylase RimI-like enzyme